MRIFFFPTASRTAPGPTHPPIQWVPGDLSLRVKRSGRETDHSPPSSAEVKKWRGAQLKKSTATTLPLPLSVVCHKVETFKLIACLSIKILLQGIHFELL
jgi:hypothetical protein